MKKSLLSVALLAAAFVLARRRPEAGDPRLRRRQPDRVPAGPRQGVRGEVRAEGRLLLRRLERPRAPDPGRRSGRRLLLGRHGEDGRAREGRPRQGGRPARVPLQPPRRRRARRLDSSRSPTPRTSRTSRRSPSRIPAAVPAGIYAKKWLTGLGLWEKIEPKVVPTLDVRARRSRPSRAARFRPRSSTAPTPRSRNPRASPSPSRTGPRSSTRVAPVAASKNPTARRGVRGLPGGARRARGVHEARLHRPRRASDRDRRRLLDPAADAARGGDRHAADPAARHLRGLAPRAPAAGPARTLLETLLSLPLVLPPTAVGLLLLEALRTSRPARPPARPGRHRDPLHLEGRRPRDGGDVLPAPRPAGAHGLRGDRPAPAGDGPLARQRARRRLSPRRPAAGLARDPRGDAARLLARARRVRRHDHDRRQHPRAHADDGARDLPAHPDRPGRRGHAAGGRHRRPRLRGRLDDRDPDAPPHADGPRRDRARRHAAAAAVPAARRGEPRRPTPWRSSAPRARARRRCSRRSPDCARAPRGAIAIDGEVVMDTAAGVFLPPEKRRIGYVPQDSCLFPHLDVARQRPLRDGGRQRRGRALRRGRRRSSRSRRCSRASRRRSRAASASAWPWRARSRPSRACCCSTSRWPASTRS